MPHPRNYVIPEKPVLFSYWQVAVEEDAQVNDNDQGGDNSYLDPKADVPDDWDQDTDDEEDEAAAGTAWCHLR